MSPITLERSFPAAQVPASPPPEPAPRAGRRSRGYAETLVVFLVSYLAYAALGIYTTVVLDLVVGDAEARLAHAYLVWWNEPAKLTAIGFYWPPLQTLVLLPLAAIKPLAVTLVALPLTSALFAAATLAVLDRALRVAEVARAVRWTIVAAIALNPLFAFYATNGMAESLYLFLLATALVVFVRWSLEPTWRGLLVAGAVIGLATLARYELALWAAILVASTVALQLMRRIRPAVVEANILVLTVPLLYGLLVWTFLDRQINGRWLGWFSALAPGGGDAPRASAADAVARIGDVVGLYALSFLPTLLVAAALAAAARAARSPVALALLAAIVVDVLLMTVFLWRSGGDDNFLQIRYAVRPLVVVPVALAWLLAISPQARRRALGVAAAAACVAAVPVTAWTMSRHDQTLGEPAFLRAVLLAENQNGVAPPQGTGNDLAATRDVAAWIGDRVDAPGSVLTDDAQTYGVLLASGRPELFLDRIAAGDEAWLRVLRDPRGRVRYVLVSRRDDGGPLATDRVAVEYPSLRSGRDLPAFARPVYANDRYAVYEVLP